ncbi:MAG: hypothetical protein KGI08_08160, partial [Thaumarchaeota archaeon]|nr:hypothetical protein [Nitrososphaerota archaeon]
MRSEENFYEYVCRLFYDFSHTMPDDVGLVLSKKTVYPLLEVGSNLHVVLPLPRIIGDKYAFEGMLFENTIDGKKSLWILFLFTLYHLAAHVAISDYQKYKEWQKDKTEDASWLVIDFIEDIRVARYIERADAEIWKNMCLVEKQFDDYLERRRSNNACKQTPYEIVEEEKIRSYLKARAVDGKASNDHDTMADLLYHNRNLLDFFPRPYHERHKSTWLIKFEDKAPGLL